MKTIKLLIIILITILIFYFFLDNSKNIDKPVIKLENICTTRKVLINNEIREIIKINPDGMCFFNSVFYFIKKSNKFKDIYQLMNEIEKQLKLKYQDLDTSKLFYRNEYNDIYYVNWAHTDYENVIEIMPDVIERNIYIYDATYPDINSGILSPQNINSKKIADKFKTLELYYVNQNHYDVIKPINDE
jgi:hypothetical protein